MREPLWIPLAAAITIHDRQISRHGGALGMRDIGLLEAALGRPVNKWGYGVEDLFELAAAYAFGIAKAHAFVDGNKRTALVCALTFLLANGTHVRRETDETVRAIEDVARDAMSEAEFAEWLRG
jgi:death-on-curing protein